MADQAVVAALLALAAYAARKKAMEAADMLPAVQAALKKHRAQGTEG
jgi:hypothetical protein